MTDETIAVYNPDDEPLHFTFNGHEHELTPEDMTLVPRASLGSLLTQVGEYGVVPVPRGTSKSELDEIVASAKKKWLAGTRKWAEDLLLAATARNKPRVDAGLQPDLRAEETKAKTWLTKHGFLKATLLLLTLLLPTLSSAQVTSVRAANFAFRYDVDSSTLTYCRVEGQNRDPFGPALPGRGRVKTTGSSTTVVEQVTGDNPFTEVAVGDVLLVHRPDGTSPGDDLVVVTARASAASITVDTSVDWQNGTAGRTWEWYRTVCGTTANDGWINVSQGAAALTLQYDQGDLTALVARFECKTAALGAQPVIVYPGKSSDCGLGGTLSTDRCSFATAGITSRLSVIIAPTVFSQCRIGLAWTGADTSDAGANIEQVTASLTTEIVGR